MLRLMPSDPLFPGYDWLLTMRAAFVNAACHYDLRDLPEGERVAMVAALTREVEQAWRELTH